MAAKATMQPVSAVPTPQASTSIPVPAGDGIKHVKDANGRTIGIRSLSVLEEMRLLKVLGEYNSSYYSFCSQVARVCEIDGQVVTIPNNEREIEVIANRLGKAGVAALMQSIVDSAIEFSDDKEREQVKK